MDFISSEECMEGYVVGVGLGMILLAYQCWNWNEALNILYRLDSGIGKMKMLL